MVHKKVNRVGERGRVELGSGRSWSWVVGGAVVHKKVNRVGERGRVELGSGRSCGA